MSRETMNCIRSLILVICTLTVLLVWKLWPRFPVGIQEKTILLNPIKSSFPGFDSRTCDEYCSPHIIVELYHHWNEENKTLEDQPFSPILYWKDKDKKPIYYLGATASSLNFCAPYIGDDNNWCRNVEWYMTHCNWSIENPMLSFSLYVDGAEEVDVLSWHRSSCEEFMGPGVTILEENVPFLQGRVNGSVAVTNSNKHLIVFPDPRGDSCWNVHCSLGPNDSYQACLQDAQLGIVEVSLETFVEIKDVACL